jgi:PPOX class probable F420-dependent enzyme
VKIPDSVTSALLETWPVARLATLGGDGAPHQVPIVFAQAGGALWSPIDGKPKRAALPQRIANLERDARASLLLHHSDDNWKRLWWLRLEAAASIRTLEPADDEARAGLSALRSKYPQYLETPIVSERRLLIRLEVRRVSSWCAGPEALELPT